MDRLYIPVITLHLSIVAKNILLQRSNTRMLVTVNICFKQHFDTRYLVFYNPSPPRMFLSLDLLSEYRIQHGANGPIYVTSSYSTWIFCRGVSGFATDCPCDVWLNTCLLHVGPPFGNRILNNSWAVGLIKWIIYLNLFVFWHMQLYMSWYIRSFFGFTFLSILYFFMYSCTNIFHRRSLFTFYIDFVWTACWIEWVISAYWVFYFEGDLSNKKFVVCLSFAHVLCPQYM